MGGIWRELRAWDAGNGVTTTRVAAMSATALGPSGGSFRRRGSRPGHLGSRASTGARTGQARPSRKAASKPPVLTRSFPGGLTAAGFLCRSGTLGGESKGVADQNQAVEVALFELAELAEFALAQAVSKKSDKVHDGLVAKLAALCVELGGPDPSPGLRLAVEAVAMAWADKLILELAAASGPLGTSPGLDRRRGWSQRRFSTMLTAVERIRRLTRRRPEGCDSDQSDDRSDPCLAIAREPATGCEAAELATGPAGRLPGPP